MNKMIETIKKDWLIILLILASLAAGIYFYPLLPEKVPSHWNIQGEIDGYSSRIFGAVGLPLINLGMYFMFIILPKLDPKGRNYESFEKSYRVLRISLHLFFVWMYTMTIYAALGNSIDMDVMVKAGVAILFLFLGNIMGKFRSNYFVGIKTPWTLASEEVWKKTHRMAAKIWVIGSLMLLAAAFVKNTPGFVIFFGVVMIMSLLPIIYSYIIFKKLE